MESLKRVINNPLQTLRVKLVIMSEQTLMNESLRFQTVVHGLACCTDFLRTGFNSHHSKMDFVVCMDVHLTTWKKSRAGQSTLPVALIIELGGYPPSYDCVMTGRTFGNALGKFGITLTYASQFSCVLRT